MRSFAGALLIVLMTAAVAGCDTVPKETVELSNTVGRDLEEIHRAHVALVELHFSKIEQDINAFIDDVYRPAYIRKFAEEFDLPTQVRRILESPTAADANKLLPVLVRFVEIATETAEEKRAELLKPVLAQKASVLQEIEDSYRKIITANAILSGHLASVVKVREVQSELLGEVGLGDVREKVAKKTADISNLVDSLNEEGQKVGTTVDGVAAQIEQIDDMIKSIADRMRNL